MTNTPTRAQEELVVLLRFAVLLDSRFRVPGTKIRFGLDSLVSLIPGFGDAVSFVVSAALAVLMLRHGATPWLVLRMVGNVIIDFATGLVPVLGDIFDVAFKANLRNVRLLEAHHEKQAAKGRSSMPGWLAVAVALVMLVVTFLVLVAGFVMMANWIYALVKAG